ncbi:hypothetical protein POTOM_011936 [Populus tomentosa]|uniref:Uncharacterized protein n=1 Tax=Populus tomentosa TaxID=118781 RepID=A0A8X8A4C4_POPTO|nr:hypothetical protein POTOM_011936 [Populus tomentosa]
MGPTVRILSVKAKPCDGPIIGKSWCQSDMPFETSLLSVAMCHGLSHGEAWLHEKLKDSGGNLPPLEQKGMDPKCLSYEKISDVSSSTVSGTSPKKPNLEFTLGRPH